MNELFLKTLHNYFMKAGQKDVQVHKIYIDLLKNDMLIDQPMITVFFNVSDTIEKYACPINLRDLKIYILETMSNEAFGFNSLSRKKLKLILIKYIRKRIIGKLINKLVQNISEQNILRTNYESLLSKQQELNNYYKSNTEECGNVFNTVFSEFQTKLKNDISYNIQLKHFMIHLNKSLNDDLKYNGFKTSFENY